LALLRHPVHQEYLPPPLIGQEFLKKEGDVKDKMWDDKLLKGWEYECNDNKPWEGREELEPLFTPSQ